MGRQVMKLDEMFLSFGPPADCWRFVILGVIGDEVHLDPVVVPKELAEGFNERFGVEHFCEP